MVLETESRFFDITLPIEGKSIDGCFEQMLLKQQSLECLCEKCGEQTSFSNRFLFRETPHVLIVTMMRFASRERKIEKHVGFGLEIDLSRFGEPGIHPLFEL